MTLGEFLRNRRGRTRPSDVGLPPGTGRRQTPGLRREELAVLAGMSVDYYIRLEQGRDTHPGPAVLDAIASALRLDADERAHLHRLARSPATRPGASVPLAVRPGLLHLLDAVRPTPAYVLDMISNVLAANPEGMRLMAGLDALPAARRNIIRYVFTHPAARIVFVSWPEIARACVADLRAAGPGRPELDALVTELSAVSAEFAELWKHYDVRVNTGSRRTFQHPAVGRFELTSEIVTAADGQRLLFCSAAPGTAGHDAITLLAMVSTP